MKGAIMHEIYARDPELSKLQADIGFLQAQVGLRKLQLAVKYDPNQPRAPAGTSIGGRWISDFARLVGRGPVNPMKIAIGAGVATGLALYEIFAGQKSRNQTPVIEFRARLFAKDESGALDLISARMLDRQEVNDACPGLPKLQEQVDRIATEVRWEMPHLSPPRFGTEVHSRFKKEVDALDRPDFKAEVSVLKETLVKYGTRGSKRYDAYQRAEGATICAYDIKTENARLDDERMLELALNGWNAFGDMKRLIIVQVKPFQ